MTVGERIEERRKQVPGLSQAELARRVGVGQSTINGLIRGDSRSSKHLHRIAAELGTTVGYLAGDTNDASEGALPIPTSNQIAEQLNSVLIPYFDVGLSMGSGRDLDDVAAVDMIPFSRSWLRSRIEGRFDQIALMDGRGDSMEPTISDGDVCAIDRAQTQIKEPDLIWAFRHADQGMIKRLRRLPKGGYQVSSDNEQVAKPFVAADDEIEIIGRVFWVGRWK